jgi:fluoride exporter
MTLSAALLLKAMWTGLAGAAGAGTRHAVSIHSRRQFGAHFPWGTLIINLSGALIAGIVAAYLGHHHQLSQWHAPLVLGFLGGYTTFSTLMLESAQLRDHAHHLRLFAYLGVTIILGPLAAFAGLVIGGWI